MKATVARHFHFNAAHRLHNSAWSDEKNMEVFGKCNNPHYHGHNYEGEIKVKGEIHPETGYVYDLKDLAELAERLIVERFDHKNLNIETEEFKTVNPTAENIAVAIWNLIKPELEPTLELTIVLYETKRNYVEYSGS